MDGFPALVRRMQAGFHLGRDGVRWLWNPEQERLGSHHRYLASCIIWLAIRGSTARGRRITGFLSALQAHSRAQPAYSGLAMRLAFPIVVCRPL
jgi:hypothetical protein